jgi:hypothetical protein
MSVRTLLRSLSSQTTRPPTRSALRAADRRLLARRLLLEGLEDRRLLAFDLAVDYPTGASPQAVITADFNNDGRLDVATANFGSSDVSVLLGNADGSFQLAQNSAVGAGPHSLAVGDFNADGKLDLATANASDVSVLFGNGNGGFQPPTNVDIGMSPGSVAVGDFNGDGKMDLVVGGHTSNYVPPWGGCGYYGCYGGGGYWVNQARVSVLIGSGNGGFAVQASYDLDGTSATAVAVVDLNGDGRADLVAGAQNSIHALLGNGDGTLQSPLHSGSYGGSITIADINGDGNLDLAMTAGGHVGVSLGNGLGAFGAPHYFAAGAGMTSVAVADFNGDGNVDLVASDQALNTVNVLLAAGATTGTVAFKLPLNVATGAWPFDVVVGDFNGDGLTDAASANYDSSASNVSVLLNDGIWPALDAPSITINDVTVTEGNTGTFSTNFNVSLSAAYSQTVTVYYATADGTATAGEDYQPAVGTLTFAPGVTNQSVSVLVSGDRLGEAYSESFSVNLSNPTNAFIAVPTAVSIINDDEPFIDIIDYGQIAEGHTGTTLATFTVTLHEAYDAPVSVDYTTADLTPDEQYWYNGPTATAGFDYVATAGTLTIPAGQLTGTISVPIKGDRVGEGYELFFVKLTSSNFAKINYSTALAEIVDDEPSVGIYSNSSTIEGNSGTTPKTFTVVLSAPYDIDIPVSYETSDGSAVGGSDYVEKTGTVIIPAGQLSQTITVLVIGDLVTESIENFYVTLTSAPGANVSGFDSALIIDDDTPPTFRIGDASVVEGNSGTKLMTFTVSLSQASGQGVSVNYATANGTATVSNNDYVANSGNVYFAPGETSKTITVTIKGDTKKEQDEQFYVNLSSPIGGTLADGQGIGTIVNDDGGGKGNGNGNRESFSASAVDAAMEDWMSSTRKKKSR